MVCVRVGYVWCCRTGSLSIVQSVAVYTCFDGKFSGIFVQKKNPAHYFSFIIVDAIIFQNKYYPKNIHN